MTSPGFIFWGIFPAFGFFLLAYAVWMVYAEKKEDRAEREREP
jgi:phage shock protein PspC (stress-responsive transcriptional regulator)